MQPSFQPNTTRNSSRRILLARFGRFKTDNQGGNRLIGFRRYYRHGDNFIDGVFFTRQITNLFFLWRAAEVQLQFLGRIKVTRAAARGRDKDVAVPVEESVERRTKRMSFRLLLVTTHHVLQFVFGVRIEKVESVIFQGGVNTRLLCEVLAEFGQSGVTDFLRAMKCVDLALE